jgi:hypothetical protein
MKDFRIRISNHWPERASCSSKHEILLFPPIISTFVISYQRETKGRLGKVVVVPIVVGVNIEKTLAKNIKYTKSKPAPQLQHPPPPFLADTSTEFD